VLAPDLATRMICDGPPVKSEWWSLPRPEQHSRTNRLDSSRLPQRLPKYRDFSEVLILGA
jgi:hypothetical protein